MCITFACTLGTATKQPPIQGAVPYVRKIPARADVVNPVQVVAGVKCRAGPFSYVRNDRPSMQDYDYVSIFDNLLQSSCKDSVFFFT